MKRRSPPKGRELLEYRLVKASEALLKLAECPELEALIAAAQDAYQDSIPEGEWGVHNGLAWDRFAMARDYHLIDLASLLSALAVPDITP